MTPRTISYRAGALVLAAGVMLAGCTAGTGAASSTTGAGSEASVSSTDATSATSATSVDASSLTAGSYTTTVDGQEVTYQAAYLVDGVDAVIDGGTYAATEADQVVFLVVNGGSLTVTGSATIAKTGAASETDEQRPGEAADSYSFYGLNSAVVVVGEGSSATLDGVTITTDSEGSNGVVAVDGGAANVTSTSITTTAGSSRGLHATFGGTITGADLTISTAGAHCADVATDRGGGTVTVTGTNSFTTAGEGSPLVYSTGTISVSGVTGTASSSEVVVVEGKNQATITDSDVTSGASHAVMIYQSMSGDAADADAATAVGAVTLSQTTVHAADSGAVFYFTNTHASVTLDDLTLDTASTVLASAQEDRWGTAGSNGAEVEIAVAGSTLAGEITAGSSSSIAVTTSGGGRVTGATSGAVTVA